MEREATILLSPMWLSLSNDSWAVCRFGCLGVNGRWILLSWFEGVEISEQDFGIKLITTKKIVEAVKC